jgi:hypothetical protein
MPKEPLRPTSLSEFIDCVSEIEKKWSREDEDLGLWYRGHTKSYWELLPNLYRDLSQKEKARDEDDEVREAFIRRAPSLSQEKPENAWDWYFLMQHYRASTRLLDWTEGSLLALYFAVRENSGYHDAAVWVLDPWWLNKEVIGVDEVIPPGASGLSKKDRQRYESWLQDRFDSARKWRKWPVAVYPTHMNRRISAQRSCFTIHGAERKPLEEILKARRGARLSKIVIPSFCVARMQEQLETAGIEETTIFPDLEGLGRSVNPVFPRADRIAPHKNVYTRLRQSKIGGAGIGVFAIKKIRRGVPLFLGENDEMLWVEAETIGKLPRQIRKLYDDFGVFRSDRCGCPRSFNALTPAWYLNHSNKPNVCCNRETLEFFALRDIREGEELTVDYSTYSEMPISTRNTRSNAGKDASRQATRSRAY